MSNRPSFGRLSATAAFHLLAAAFCLAALSMCLRTVEGLRWPGEVDLLRDIAQAQTIADGNIFGDAFYADETSWYPPLVPAIVAGISRLGGIDVARVHTRAGVFLNLLAPVAFYALCNVLFGPGPGLAALVAFLFLAPLPEWASATYSPWLFASSFAQAPFYAGLACFVAWWRNPRRSRLLVTTGLLGGVAMLAHSAPAYLLLITVTISCLAAAAQTAGHDRRRMLTAPVVVACLVVVVALPYLLPLAVRYRLVIVNAAPLLWNDPAFTWAQSSAFVGAAVRPTLLHAGVVVGLMSLAWRRRADLLPFWACLAAAACLFIFTAWVRPGTALSWLDRLPFGPSQHFLRYARASCALGFGVGLVAAVDGLIALAARASRRHPADTAVWQVALLGIVTVLIVIASWPAYSRRADFTSARRASTRVFAYGEFRGVTRWLRFSTKPEDVFLASESAGTSIIGTSGRKVVAVGKFFSSPYVDWPARKQAQDGLWAALDESRCDDFARGAAAYGVTYVMSVRARTPQIENGRCGLALTGLNGNDLKIYRVQRQCAAVVTRYETTQ